MKIVAIIPARSGSESIKNKNLALLDNHPLIAYSIVLAKMVPQIDKVIVSTDSKRYAEISKKFGAEVPFLRPAKLSGNKSSDYDFMLHAVKWFEKNSKLPEYFVHLRPTTPLRDPSIVKKAIDHMISNKEATALRSCHLAPESPFKWFRINKKGFFTDLSGKDTKLDEYNGPRQNYPDVFIPNGYVDIVRSSVIKEQKLLHGNKVLAFQTPFCNEVDTAEELELIKYQLKTNGSKLTKKLNLIAEK